MQCRACSAAKSLCLSRWWQTYVWPLYVRVCVQCMCMWPCVCERVVLNQCTLTEKWPCRWKSRDRKCHCVGVLCATVRVRPLNTLLPIQVVVSGRAGPRACAAYGLRQAAHTINCVCVCVCVSVECQDERCCFSRSYLVVGLGNCYHTK